jgi:hypothetical protein
VHDAGGHIVVYQPVGNPGKIDMQTKKNVLPFFLFFIFKEK